MTPMRLTWLVHCAVCVRLCVDRVSGRRSTDVTVALHLRFFPNSSTRDPKVKGVLTGLRASAYSQRRRLATLLAALVALAIGYHVIFGQNGLTAFKQKRQSASALERETRMLNAENEALQGHVDRLGKDPDAIERQAREELHYTRPGEVIVTLPPDPAPAKVEPAPASRRFRLPWVQ